MKTILLIVVLALLNGFCNSFFAQSSPKSISVSYTGVSDPVKLKYEWDETNKQIRFEVEVNFGTGSCISDSIVTPIAQSGSNYWSMVFAIYSGNPYCGIYYLRNAKYVTPTGDATKIANEVVQMSDASVSNGVLKGKCAVQYDKFESIGLDNPPTLTKYTAMSSYNYKDKCKNGVYQFMTMDWPNSKGNKKYIFKTKFSAVPMKVLFASLLLLFITFSL